MYGQIGPCGTGKICKNAKHYSIIPTVQLKIECPLLTGATNSYVSIRPALSPRRQRRTRLRHTQERESLLSLYVMFFFDYGYSAYIYNRSHFLPVTTAMTPTSNKIIQTVSLVTTVATFALLAGVANAQDPTYSLVFNHQGDSL